ncbi:predicted protein [Scheffersomyces stipitis CBS 6054]|uniref:E3 ubiquitin-protein ligase PEP5 n=1 Tax=Scheffersomyces stipitis (strain ATCC 58785 / CBS 6054 / NBRC 10063 / NRRL Y-11545) TaxID=322104 RepID=A3LS75_PICST|nr:predicted protein [Scheffersomyces stipitis CBS 6054]ABN65519.2 predicted protein [Scheffersomyces stipitis CBS 6054]
MSTLPSSWTQFQLFDYTPIRDPNFQTNDSLYSDASLSAIHATNSYLVIATNNAFLKIIASKNLQLLKTFIAYDLDYRISFVRSLPNSDLLITLAEKQGSPSIVKLWDLNRIIHLQEEDQDVLKFKFQTQALVTNADNSYPISSFEFSSDLTCIAIGYTNGKVILIRGDLLRDRGSKQRLIYESTDPVTNIAFNKYEDLLYITTTSKILTVSTSGRNQRKPQRILSNKTGIDLNCSVIDPKSQYLIVGTTDSIRYYSHLNKIRTIKFEIPKSRIFRFGKNYLLIVSPHQQELLAQESISKKKKSFARVLILDIFNKHISFNFMIPDNTINHVFVMQNDVHLLSNDGVLYKLHEKPINQQIESIIQRELFPVAYNLAVQASMPNDLLLRIQKLYGDFLYEKQENEASIDIYIKCLDLFEKSVDSQGESVDQEDDLDDFVMTVITKFKDAANIPNLTKFLFKLYELKEANNDHITLLLCCYCKLKMTEELDKFINDLDLDEDNNLQDLNFQLIINLFKECGYFTQVIRLLFRLNQPNLIVGIQLNDLKQPRNSLNYIKSLPIDELLLILTEHSKTFLDDCPIETTELLINVFTGKYIPNGDHTEPFSAEISSKKEEKSEETEAPSTLNNYRAFLNYLSGNSTDDIKSNNSNELSVEIQEPTYLPPRPSLIFPSFINHPNQFVIFLEACIESFDKYQGNMNDKKDLLITLLEMYLSLSKESKTNSAEEEWKNKARILLQENSSLLNNSSLLLLSNIYDFQEGEALAKEKAGHEESLLHSYQLSGDISGCFDLLRKYGEKKPEMYKLMLKFVVSKKEIFERINPLEFRFLFDTISSRKLMNPLEILQILTENPANDFITLGLIKDYLIDYFDNQNKEISNNTKLIGFYEGESTKSSHKLTELTNKPFVIQNNKCSACDNKLDFPVIHFRCKHSYHQKCLTDYVIASVQEDMSGERRCPKCVNEIEEIKAIRAGQFKSKENLELFEGTLNETQDKFRYISEYLGKGVMENESVVLFNE